MKTIILEGEFGWEIYSSRIRELLDKANGEDLDVRIASRGGSVFEGIKVFNDFRDYKRKYPESQNMLTVKGLAASMASYFSMNPAFELVVVEDNAVLMLHNPTGFVGGDYREAQKFSELLKGLTDILAEAYVKKTGKSKKEIRDMMNEETWFFGSEIVDAGFADEILETEEEKDKAAAIATAKLQYKEIENKLKTLEIEDNDIREIAASIKVEPNNKQEQNPAISAGENKPGGLNKMTLEELKAQHPELYKEIFNLGKDAGLKEVNDRIETASKFIGNSEYPKQISDAAVAVAKGEKSVDALDTMVASVDMFKEIGKSNAAAGETPQDTPPDGNQNNQMSQEYLTDGTIMNAADMAAEEKRILGQGVN
jgi:ATP-dependent Clp protease protease subunit